MCMFGQALHTASLFTTENLPTMSAMQAADGPSRLTTSKSTVLVTDMTSMAPFLLSLPGVCGLASTRLAYGLRTDKIIAMVMSYMCPFKCQSDRITS